MDRRERIDGLALLQPDIIHALIEKLRKENRDEDFEQFDQKTNAKLLRRRENISQINDIYCKIEDEYQMMTENKPPQISEEELKRFTQLMADMPVFDDSRTVSTFHELMNRMTQLVKLRIRDLSNRAGGKTFDAKAFGKGFKSITGLFNAQQDLDKNGWICAGRKLRHLLCHAPKFASIAHLMTEENRAIVKVPRSRIIQNAKRGDRTELKEANITNEDASLAKYIIHMKTVLKRHFHNNGGEPIPFYQFAVDPRDFSQTVENIFHLSFIIKDVYARIAVNEETNELEIRKVTKAERNFLHADDRSKSDTHQMFCGIDYDLWKRLIKKYDLAGKEPMIPPIELSQQ